MENCQYCGKETFAEVTTGIICTSCGGKKIRTNEQMLVSLNNIINSLNNELSDYKVDSGKFNIYQMEVYKVNFNIVVTDELLKYFNNMKNLYINGFNIHMNKLPLNKHIDDELESTIYTFTSKSDFTKDVVDLEIIRLKLFYILQIKKGY